MERVNIGVIGAGGRSELAEFLKGNEKVHIVGIADIIPAQAKQLASYFDHEIFQTTDYRRLLERNDIDAVLIVTPDYLHEEHALAAMQAGKYVYLEKPMAITIEGCDRLLKARKQYGNKIMVGFNMRYSVMFQTMKRIIDRGDIGEVKAVWVRHFVGRGGDYYFHDWHAKQSATTSLMLQKASHDIDVIHWLTGSYGKTVAGFGGLDYFGGSKPNDLQCPTCSERETCWEYNKAPRTQCAFRSEVDVEDNQVIIMKLQNGIKVSYTQCHFTPDYHRNFTVIGTEGRIENSQPDARIWVKHRRNIPETGVADPEYFFEKEAGHVSADHRILNDFINMVLTDGKPPVDLYDGRMSVAVGVKAAESIRAGGQVMEIPAVAD